MPGFLGDSFPEEYRKKFCDDHLVPGAVLKIYAAHTKPPKIKRCVVVALDAKSYSLALVFINTHKPASPYLEEWQMPLPSKGRAYLGHDSYLDCAQLYEENLRKVRRLLTENIEMYLGRLSDEDLAEAKQLLSSAKTVTTALKKKYDLL